jgi:hypothetical protein
MLDGTSRSNKLPIGAGWFRSLRRVRYSSGRRGGRGASFGYACKCFSQTNNVFTCPSPDVSNHLLDSPNAAQDNLPWNTSYHRKRMRIIRKPLRIASPTTTCQLSCLAIDICYPTAPSYGSPEPGLSAAQSDDRIPFLKISRTGIGSSVRSKRGRCVPADVPREGMK